MIKIFFLLTSTLLLVSCAETMALLGPASSVVGGGNVAQSTVSSVVNYGIKKGTGKTPIQHALAYAEEKNPNKKKERCISFIEKTNSEACMILNKQIALTQANVAKKISSTKNLIKKKKQVILDKTDETENKTHKTENKTDLLIKSKKSARELVSLVRTKIKEYDARWLDRVEKSQEKFSNY